MAFDLGGLLHQVLGGAQQAGNAQMGDDFQRVPQQAPSAVVEQGLSEAFRSDQTPPFSQMVGGLFGNADPQQKAGMLGQLLNGLNPGVLASIVGGLGGLGGMLGANHGTTPAVTEQQASQVTPEQVTEIAAQAEQHNPGIVDKMSNFYVNHPDLVKTIGSAALAIVLAKVAQAQNRG